MALNRPTKQFWQDKSFKQLEDEWNQKLIDSGFDDIERSINDDRVLKQYASNVYRQADQLTIQAKEQYYTLIQRSIRKQKFTSKIDKLIMNLWTEGAKIVEIVNELERHQFRFRSDGKINRRTVRQIIRRWEMKWKIKTWEQKQLNHNLKQQKSKAQNTQS